MRLNTWVRPVVLAGLGLMAMFSTTDAIAAETVVLKYRIFRESIPVAELTQLAETGEAPPKLDAYLRLARQDPQEVQNTLNQDVAVNVTLLDRVLNSPVGNVVIDQVSEVISTPSGRANRQAMRSALILSASDDGRISLIEVIENYPTAAVHVDGDRLLEAYQQISILGGRVEGILERIRLFK